MNYHINQYLSNSLIVILGCGSCAAEAVLVLATRVATLGERTGPHRHNWTLENDEGAGALVCEGGRGTGPGDSMDGMSLWQVAK